MKYFLIFNIAFFLTLSPLDAKLHLPYLDECSQETSLELLENINLQNLWDHFLSIQTDLYIEQEAKLISQDSFWKLAENVLELGSGNGEYLHLLSEKFQDKRYLGTDIASQFIEQSKQLKSSSSIFFEEDDAEVLNENYLNQFDVVITRLLLQHVQKPLKVLENASKYLKEGGHVMIIDAYDPIWTSSHKISSLKEAISMHNERNKKFKEGNRKITLEILNQIARKKGPLANLYEIAYSNISKEGFLLEGGMKFSSEKERKLYFNQILLYLNILNKERKIPVDFAKAHQELQVYLTDENAWIVPPLHLLILRKK